MRVIDYAACIIGLSFFGCSAGAPDANGEASASSPSLSQEEALQLRQICAGPSDLACAKGSYCNSIVRGRCPGPSSFGVCAKKPDLCTDLFAPVCGCDGQTYSNSCFAAAVGVAVEHAGACAVATGPACGGFAGTPCPGIGRCVDDPTDNCDPAAGGNDCIGICSCIENIACKLGTHFDSDPNVCSCVPDAPRGPQCGGFAGIPCPGMGRCVDDPTDDCDPKAGGADCIGICSCIQNVACRLGTHFNSDPEVCTCVPDAAKP